MKDQKVIKNITQILSLQRFIKIRMAEYKNIKKFYILSTAVLFSLICGCSQKEDTKVRKIGKYVYVDSQNILHTKNHCVLGMRITNSNGDSYDKSIEFIDTAMITNYHLKSLCNRCVNDEQYEQLKNIAERHEELNSKHGLNWGKETDW